eukprot:jgi/Tetstr1/430799/TSEL_020583.t1
MGDTPTADEARAATLEREKLSALSFLGVIPFHVMEETSCRMLTWSGSAGFNRAATENKGIILEDEDICSEKEHLVETALERQAQMLQEEAELDAQMVDAEQLSSGGK